jgi:hypothetical protein
MPSDVGPSTLDLRITTELTQIGPAEHPKYSRLTNIADNGGSRIKRWIINNDESAQLASQLGQELFIGETLFTSPTQSSTRCGKYH